MSVRSVAMALALAAVAAPAAAQQDAAIFLKSGERISGSFAGLAITMKVNGSERTIPLDDIAILDLGGPALDDQRAAQAASGRPVVFLRTGNTTQGRVFLSNDAGRLRIVVADNNGNQEYGPQVGRIYFAKAPAGADNPPSNQAGNPANGTTITVNANQAWTATGITVRRGQVLTFSSSGEIHLSGDANDVASVDGARSGRVAPSAPLPRSPAGALIGRIGTGQPFGIGSQQRITAPATGQLFLGVNDDGFNDNQGSFQVTISRQ